MDIRVPLASYFYQIGNREHAVCIFLNHIIAETENGNKHFLIDISENDVAGKGRKNVLLDKGSPMTFYAEPDGLHNIGWGARIYPLTEQQARIFMESPDTSFYNLF